MVDIITSNGIRTLLSNGLHSIRLVVARDIKLNFYWVRVTESTGLTPTYKQVTLRLIRYSFKLYFCVAKRVGDFMPVMNDFTGKFQKISWGRTINKVVGRANSKTARTARSGS